MRAAYKLTDRCIVFIERDHERETEAIVYVVGRSPSSDVSAAAADFRNELIDQQLRCLLEAQFNDVRTLIVAQAFSEGNLIDADADEGDYRTDPLGAGAHR
jgi:His-Xaa-Ser system protein HxsD